ncbi:hypothetical protein [Pandoravirus japonicus]|uniref:Uncharacterized protein n=1 Tax=Pandoravirus japonicus TaxID=2823154 RepID=A0A811BNJ5_9VIRU|nr:hypothetical protein [Pandoravirus japonicus]
MAQNPNIESGGAKPMIFGSLSLSIPGFGPGLFASFRAHARRSFNTNVNSNATFFVNRAQFIRGSKEQRWQVGSCGRSSWPQPGRWLVVH